MTMKQISTSFCLTAATALLGGVAAIAQTPGSGSQQPNMPGQQQSRPATDPAMGNSGAYPGSVPALADSGDRSFVTNALEGGEAEVQLGQLAEQKSQSDDVKQFAQKMVLDHSQMANKWFKPVAQQMGVSVPTGPSKKDKKLIAKLEGLSGDEFDRQYITAMVKDHQQDLKEFKEKAQNAQDPNVKQVAQQGSNVISQHLQLIEQIAKNHNLTVDGKSPQALSMQ